MKRNVSVVRLIVVTRSSGPPASGKIIKEMPGSVRVGHPIYFAYIFNEIFNVKTGYLQLLLLISVYV
jgi:hypothetical protein